jgi:hypothetical protein
MYSGTLGENLLVTLIDDSPFENPETGVQKTGAIDSRK